jgi:hypothetical protein
LKELEDISPEGETQLTKILKLEKNYENITNCVLGIYKKHDMIMKDVIDIIDFKI